MARQSKSPLSKGNFSILKDFGRKLVEEEQMMAQTRGKDEHEEGLSTKEWEEIFRTEKGIFTEE